MSHLRNTMIAAILLATASVASAAEARINGPRLTSLDFACGALQDRADALLAEYARVWDQDQTSARLPEIIRELQNINADWNAIGCNAAHGSITQIRTGTPALQQLQTAEPAPRRLTARRVQRR